jgi:cytidine deaminase
LVDEALAARANAYAPYSGFAVGAALLTEDGTIFLGCNVENASFPAGICAERGALVSAVTAGQRSFQAIAVAVEGPRPSTPCGICRQVLAEFAPRLRVIMATTGGARAVSDLAALLPGAFSSVDLGAQPPSLSQPDSLSRPPDATREQPPR